MTLSARNPNVALRTSARRQTSRRAVFKTLQWALSVAALTGCACGCEKTDTLADRPNVLLITVDTLRADHLGTYGYAIDTSPNINELAAGGAVVERCIASAPETAPAIASILTGLYQDEHTVLYNRKHLPDDVTTLAERFAEAGYATAGFTGNFLVGPKFGFGQGFEVLENFADKFPFQPRDQLGTAAAVPS